MELFEISADRLATVYKSLNCDGCGAPLTPDPEAVWIKSGCGYFCPDCVAAGRHLTAPCALRRRG
jgi:hypothetical protein